MSLQCDNLSGELQDQWSSSFIKLYFGPDMDSLLQPVTKSGYKLVKIAVYIAMKKNTMCPSEMQTVFTKWHCRNISKVQFTTRFCNQANSVLLLFNMN